MTHMLLMSFDDSEIMKLHNTLNRFIEYAFILLQKKNIQFCYIGTAGNDNLIERWFFSTFIRAKFGRQVHTSQLLLTKTQLTHQQMEEFITKQDIVFIGGGNTKKMLEIWEKSGFTQTLNKLKNESRLPILAGVSAGGMYPFHSGLTDSTPGQYKPLSCLQWYSESFCPHADSKNKAICAFDNNQQHLERMEAYTAAVKAGLLPAGYAVQDDCMLHFHNFNLVRAVTSRENNLCYYVTPENNTPIETTLLTSKNILKIVHDTENALLNDTKIIFKKQCWHLLFQSINIVYRCLTVFRRLIWT